MNRIILLLLIIKVNSQEIAINKDSNNLTLDGNVEFADKNLIEAEKFYRESISKDSLNIKASYNLANSFYRSELKQEAINQYKSSIKKQKAKKPFTNLFIIWAIYTCKMKIIKMLLIHLKTHYLIIQLMTKRGTIMH